MKKIIFVNATAATEGGILTVLRQFINEIEIRNQKHVNYYVFSTINIKTNCRNINIISNIKGKNKLDRIIWDIVGMKKWAEKNSINPDVIISLQNTGVIFNGIRQIIYIHQPLPYAKESKWSIFKVDERKMWFYKNIYKLWIDFTVKNKSEIIVQTEWMKLALINRGYIEEKITISKPSIKKVDINSIPKIKESCKFLFYPAADYKYKNHNILVNSIKSMRDKGVLKEGDFKIIFTLTKDSNIYKIVNKYGLEKYFEFIGAISYDKVLSYYKSCQAVVFPSYIETFGLPLIEASTFGKKILVADCSYSKEVLSNYKLVKFIRYNDIEKWEKELIYAMDSYEEIPTEIKYKNNWETMFECIEKQLNN